MAVEILNWKSFQKNTLQGFLDLKLTQIGLEIRGCTLHRKNEERWIGLPARQYEDETGQTKWVNVLRFDENYHKKFQEAALNALDTYLRAPKQEEPTPDDIPF